MTHPAWEALNRLAEQETDPAETAALRAHLTACPTCAMTLARLERLRATAAAAPPMTAPPASWLAVRTRITDAPPPTTVRRSPARWIAPALAASLALVAAAVAIRQATRSAEPPAPHDSGARPVASPLLDASAELEASYRTVRTRFTPAARAAADAALADVEAAIREAASAADAGDDAGLAAEMLRRGQAQKLDLLRRYTEMAVTL
jgi:hypothetical protein